MVERTADTESFDQLEVASTTEQGGQINRISRLAKANALVGADAAAAEHREVRRATRGGDHVLGVTLGVRRVDLDVVSRTGRDVLDLQRSHHRAAPLVFGVTADFRQGSWNAAGAQDVVRAAHLMTRGRNLEQTPGLIDADVADDIGSVNSAIGVGTRADGGAAGDRKI